MDRPVSWANTPKEWNFKTLLLDEPDITIRRRAFYRAIDKLTDLRLIHRSNPGSYPACWTVGNSKTEQKAVRDYLWRRQLENGISYGTGRDETRAQKRENLEIKVKAFKILGKPKGTPYKPKFYYLDDLKQIVEQNRLENRLLKEIKAQQKKVLRRPGNLDP